MSSNWVITRSKQPKTFVVQKVKGQLFTIQYPDVSRNFIQVSKNLNDQAKVGWLVGWFLWHITPGGFVLYRGKENIHSEIQLIVYQVVQSD